MNDKRFLRFSSCLCVLCLCFLVSASAYTDEAPVDAPFTGCCYISCSTSQFGDITVYLPITYQSGYFSYTSAGLVNISTSSISGVFYDGGIEYTFRCSSWSTPQYREVDGSSYSYADLTVNSIEYSNVQIAESFPPLVSSATILSYIPVLLLGVIVLCLFMKRF